MAEVHVVGVLRKKRAEIFGRIIGLEKELHQWRADMNLDPAVGSGRRP